MAAQSAAAPAPARPEVTRDVPSVELRLAIGKDGLGLELARPARLGCVDVTELSVRLPGARFPIDVSGGVSRFRHKRGTLERVVVEIGARGVEAWAAPRLRGLLSPNAPRVWLALRGERAIVCVSDVGDVLAPTDAAAPRVLAFDLLTAARGDEVHLVVTGARGIGLPRPATAMAIGAVDALLGGLAERRGALFALRGLGARLGKALLPDAGARAPDTGGLVVTALAAHEDIWLLHATRGGAPAAVSAAATRAIEAAGIAKDADEARLAGQIVRARALDLAALERAPRHPEVCRRIAEIDAHVGGRAEAALLTLREAERDPDARPSVLAGELALETGDVRAAVAAFARAGEEDEAPLLAAFAYGRAADLAADPVDGLIWLDLAIARAADAPALRWSRVARRLAAGRLEDALGDVEHLEALAPLARDKYAIWRRAGDAWRAASAAQEALPLYERALRYAPDDPAALAGLGAALVADGRAARGAALLVRAIELADAAREPTAHMLLELARALADALGDRPAAVARVRAIPNHAPEALAARGLEGRWRAALGDLAGASLAFARLRDLAGTLDSAAPSAAQAIALLAEAATFEDAAMGDLLAAQRHLACALRLRPRDAAIEDAYRAIGRRVVGKPAGDTAAGVASGSTTTAGTTAGGAAGASAGATASAATDAFAPEDDEARVEHLTRALQANPDDDAVVDELAHRLSRLGRSLELFALLSARLEDAPPDRRARLVPKQREVLARLAEDARAEGRDSEAELFESAKNAL